MFKKSLEKLKKGKLNDKSIRIIKDKSKSNVDAYFDKKQSKIKKMCRDCTWFDNDDLEDPFSYACALYHSAITPTSVICSTFDEI